MASQGHGPEDVRLGSVADREWLAAIVESSEDAIIGKRLDGTIVSWNRAATRLFGYADHEIIGQSVLRLIPLELQDEEPRIVARVARGERVEHYETVRLRKDGSRFDVSLSVSPIRDPHGRIVGAAKIARDVTEQHQLVESLQQQATELELQMEEARVLAEELEHANDATELLDHASQLLASSLDFETTLGNLARSVVPRLADWCAIDVVEHPESAAWPPKVRRITIVHQDPAKVALAEEMERRYPTDWTQGRDLPQVLRTGQSLFYPTITDEMIRAAARDDEQLRLLRAIGFSAVIIVPLVARHSVLGALTLVMSESGRHYDNADLALAEELARRAGVAVDHARLFRATETARAEAQSAARLAEAANRAKSDFLATMSHELRTPLNAVSGYAQLLELEIAGPVTEQQREYLERIRASNRHLLGLINDVLDLSKIDAGQLGVSERPAMTGDAVRASLEITQPQAQTRHVQLRDETGGARGVPYVGDPDRVRQILVNLLSNAVKFTQRGGWIALRSGTVEQPPPRTELGAKGPWAYIQVEDNGPGIPAEMQSAVFDPFVQVDSGKTRSHGGTGLGLAISRRLARLMGGDLALESEPGAGSTFTLWLRASPDPLRAESEDPIRTPVADDATLHLVRGLAAVGGILRSELDMLLRSWTSRMRTDPSFAGMPTLSVEALEDHTLALLADLAQALVLADRTGEAEGALLEDGTRIQSVIAVQHGRLRRRLGFAELQLAREYELLDEVLAHRIDRILAAAEDRSLALDVLRNLVRRARDAALHGYHEMRAEAASD